MILTPLFDPAHAAECGFLVGADLARTINVRLTPKKARDLKLMQDVEAIVISVIDGLCAATLPAVGFPPAEIEQYRGAALKAYRDLVQWPVPDRSVRNQLH